MGNLIVNIGFIGLGTMGAHMALNIRKAGHALCVHDIRRDSAKALLETGARWADSPALVARDADVVFIRL